MISSDFPPMTGGIQNHVYNLSIEIAKKCDLSLLLIGQPKKCSPVEKTENFTVYRIAKKGLFISRIDYLLAAITIIKSNSIDIVHAHTLGEATTLATIACLFLHKPFIVTVHESNFIIDLNSKKYDRFFKKIKYRIKLKFAKNIIAPSAELKYYINQVVGSKKNVMEIPNGVDLSIFHSLLDGTMIRNSLTDSQHQKIVLCPRRIVQKNGVIFLVKAIPKILLEYPDIKFTFAGPICEHDYFSAIQEIIETDDNLRKHVVFTGGIPNNKMPLYYAASDIVVIPSLIEAISLAALEAMACGKPIIATSVGGLPEIITNDYNGLLVKPADSDALAEAILTIIGNEQLAYKLKQNSLAVVDAFSWRAVAECTFRCYRDI